MSLGRSSSQSELFDEVDAFCDESLPKESIYSFLRRERDRLFPDSMFEDLYSRRGRSSIPPSMLAVVMVLQRLEGLSDREAVERFSFDTRWRYATGAGGYGEGRIQGFVHTVLVYTRERLRLSEDPDRIFRVVLEAAKAAGLVGRKRVLDSTALYDSVSTMDTITLIRSAIRGVLRCLDPSLASEVRALLVSGDDYASSAKPQIDWSDEEAQAELIDSRARDGYACLEHLQGRPLPVKQREAADLLATVLGQDLESDDDGRHRIIRGVAKDRVISTVDPETRHGHKTEARSFDGYKGHVSVDPESELIIKTEVTAGNVADGTVAEDLIHDILNDSQDQEEDSASQADEKEGTSDTEVYGDSSYGTGSIQESLESAGIKSYCKTPKPSNRGGRFGKDRFHIDLETRSVTCPAGITLPIPASQYESVQVTFGAACSSCALRDRCTSAAQGRSVRIGAHERSLAKARRRQEDPAWQKKYKQIRPIVERKLAHCMRRRHGGRKARMRGSTKVSADFSCLAAAINLARLAVLGLRSAVNGWTTQRA